MLRIISILLFSFISIVSKSEFSKREFVAANFNTIISLTLNANSIPGFAKINVLVKHEITNIPTDCFKEKNKSKCN